MFKFVKCPCECWTQFCEHPNSFGNIRLVFYFYHLKYEDVMLARMVGYGKSKSEEVLSTYC